MKLHNFEKSIEITSTKNCEKARKKWAYGQILKTKVGRKNQMYFLKMAFLGDFLSVFGRFTTFCLNETDILPTCPFLFFIKCDKKFNIYINNGKQSGLLVTSKFL